MNSIFKHSKLDEMQEIKQLKIEHYAFWALFIGLTAAVFVQVGQQAPFAQYAWELALLGAVSVGSLIANLWCGLWDRTARPTTGTNALAALVSQLLQVCDAPHIALLYTQLTAVRPPIDPALPQRALLALQARHSSLQTALAAGIPAWTVDETPDCLCLAETPASPHWRELCDVALTRVLLQ